MSALTDTHVFGPKDLESIDRSVVIMMRGGSYYQFSDEFEDWKFSEHYERSIKEANRVTELIILRTISSLGIDSKPTGEH